MSYHCLVDRDSVGSAELLEEPHAVSVAEFWYCRALRDVEQKPFWEVNALAIRVECPERKNALKCDARYISKVSESREELDSNFFFVVEYCVKIVAEKHDFLGR